MRVSKLSRYIAVLLIITFVLPTGVFAVDNDEHFALGNAGNLSAELIRAEETELNNIYNKAYELEHVGSISETPKIQAAELSTMFNIRYTPGSTHAGYIFRLVEHAVVPFTENKGIGVIHAPKNLFVANSLEDILNFVSPEMILRIDPDNIIYLDSRPRIESDLPIFAPHAFPPVNDRLFRDQWGLEFIRGPAAWSTSPAIFPSEIIVAVIDTGINRTHPDLIDQNILDGRNFFVSTCDYCGTCDDCIHERTRCATNTDDDCGHGTGVASVIAATRSSNINEGIASMACGVTILPLRVFTNPYPYVSTRESIIIAAIYYAVRYGGADIINMSFGDYEFCGNLRDAVDFAAANGVWMIAAAGNSGHRDDGTAMIYPAGYNNVIGVGAITRHGERWYRSQQSLGVFVTMPGEEILMAYHYIYHQIDEGSSFSAPKITALAAIARAYNSDMTQDQFRELLRNSAIPRGTHTHNSAGQRIRNNQYGYGIVDVGLFMYNLTRRDFFNFTDAIEGEHVSRAARGYIVEAARWGIMHGRVRDYTSDRNENLGSQHSFWPHTAMWRLEFPMALGRLYELSGRNIRWENAAFSDANAERLFPYNYTRYVRWAAANNILPGAGGNQFNPGGDVTRESAAVMFYRFTRLLAQNCTNADWYMINYLSWIDYDPRGFLRERFPYDYHLVSDWAVLETAWAVASGAIEGRRILGRFYLAPGESITRAEGAILIGRYRRRFTNNTLWNLVGGTTNWSHLTLNFGTTTHTVNIFANDNIAHFLSWLRGGEFANHQWFEDSNFATPLSGTRTASSTPLTLYARWGNHPNLRPPGSPNANPDRGQEDGSPPNQEDRYDAAENIRRFVCPIVLDLTGNGLETVGLDAGVYFDMNNDGFATRTGWITPNNGFLVLDRTGSGTIDSGRELFGDQTLLKDGVTLANNGFQALAEFDIDGRGVIDASTPIFPYLRVWVDKNMDGITDPGELYTLPELGIEAISLIYISAFSTDNILMRTSFARMYDGTFRDVGEFLFANNPFLSFERFYTPRTPEIMALPNIYESGRLLSLHTAMVRDPVLQQMVEDYVNEPSFDARQAMVRLIIFRWAGVEDIVPDSRGRFVDARELAVLELIFARAFVGLERTGNPNNRAGPELTAIYSRFEGYVFRNLERGSWLSTWLSYLPDIDLMFDQLDNALAQDSGVANISVLRSLERFFAGTNADYRIALITRFAYYLSGWEFDGVVIGTSGDDELTVPNHQIHHVFGLGGNDIIRIGNRTGNNLIHPGPGDNVIFGGWGQNRFFIGRDCGLNTIHAFPGGSASFIRRGTVEFTDNIKPDEVFFVRRGANLMVYITEQGIAENIMGMTEAINGTGITSMFTADTMPMPITPLELIEEAVLDTLSGQVGSYIFESVTNKIMIVEFFNHLRYQIVSLNFPDGTVITVDDIMSPNRPLVLGTDSDDDITVPGGAQSHTVHGFGGNDIIRLNTNSGDNLVHPGPGNNVIFGGLGQNRYFISRGYGLNTINAFPGGTASFMRRGTVVFTDDIKPDEVFFVRRGADLMVYITEQGIAKNIMGMTEAINGMGITSMFAADTMPVPIAPLELIEEAMLDTLSGQMGSYIFEGVKNRILIVNFFNHIRDQIVSLNFPDGTVITADDILSPNRPLVLGTEGDDEIIVPGGTQSHTVHGFGGNDIIRLNTNSGDNLVHPGPGNNVIFGGLGQNRYFIGRGYGLNTINVFPGGTASFMRRGTVVFTDNIKPDEVFFVRRGADLMVYITEQGIAENIMGMTEAVNGMSITSMFAADTMPVPIAPLELIEEAMLDTLSDQVGSYIFKGVTNRILIVEFFNNNRNQIVSLDFPDGTVITADDILSPNRPLILGTEGDDEITVPGGAQSHTVHGFGGNDIIRLNTNSGNNLIHPGPGDNVIFGGSGQNRYFIGRGYGLNTIHVFPGGTALHIRRGTVVFTDDIKPDEVFFVRRGADLMVYITEQGITENIMGMTEAINGMGITSMFAADIMPAPIAPLELIEEATLAALSGQIGSYIFEGVTNRILIMEFFNNNRNQIASLDFPDGTVITADDILSSNRPLVLGTEGDDEIIVPGGAQSHTVHGFGGNDIIRLNTNSGNNLIHPGPGDNVIFGGSGQSRYFIGRGYGLNTLHVQPSSNALNIRRGTVVFTDDISPDEVFFVRRGADLMVYITEQGIIESYIFEGATNRILIRYFFNNNRNQIVSLNFPDGTVITTDDILNPDKLLILGTEGDDDITVPAGTQSHTVHGFGGNNIIRISANSGDNLIHPGQGDNVIFGGLGQNRYFIGRGYGFNTIHVAPSPTALNIRRGTVVFTYDIKPDEVFFARRGSDLMVYITEQGIIDSYIFEGTTNMIRFVNFFYNHRNQIVSLNFPDGTVITADDILSPNRLLVLGTDGDDEITAPAGALNYTVHGFGGNDIIRINPNTGNNIIHPGSGNNRIYGGSGTDTYVIGRGYGINTITAGNANNSTITPAARDLLVFRDDIRQDEVFFIRDGNNLEIHVTDSAENIVIFIDFFRLNQRQVVSITFGDGTVLLRQDLLNIVNQLPQASTIGFEAAIVSRGEIKVDEDDIDDYYDYEYEINSDEYELKEKPSDDLYSIEYNSDMP